MTGAKRFKAEQRIRSQNAFKNLAEKGVFAKGRFFLLWAAAKDEITNATTGPSPALGVVVSRRAQAKATKRNVIKRQVREIFRSWQAHLKKDRALLIKAKEGQEIPTFKEAEEDLLNLFKKTRIFCETST